ncbi:SdpI family protein, partial [Candidatus Dojkabacteria bacterium]|nr:SdpI family protein [Candidatus Dojkabacteria bacterium]
MKKYIINILILCLSILISILFYRYLPESMASHWNGEGVVDGYSSRLFNVLFFPLLGIFLFILFIFIPKIDPKWKSIKMFEGKFNLFISSMLLFMVILQLEVYLWNIGIEIPMGVFMPILMGGLFIVMSVLIKNAKQNYTIGIRTPWTLHSERVWDKTHALGAKLFLGSGILSICSAIVPKYSIWIVIGSVMLSALYLFIYSYVE